MIEVKHIWFSYEQWGEFVLKDISFSVEKGEIVGGNFRDLLLSKCENQEFGVKQGNQVL